MRDHAMRARTRASGSGSGSARALARALALALGHLVLVRRGGGALRAAALVPLAGR